MYSCISTSIPDSVKVRVFVFDANIRWPPKNQSVSDPSRTPTLYTRPSKKHSRHPRYFDHIAKCDDAVASQKRIAQSNAFHLFRAYFVRLTCASSIFRSAMASSLSWLFECVCVCGLIVFFPRSYNLVSGGGTSLVNKHKWSQPSHSFSWVNFSPSRFPQRPGALHRSSLCAQTQPIRPNVCCIYSLRAEVRAAQPKRRPVISI